MSHEPTAERSLSPEERDAFWQHEALALRTAQATLAARYEGQRAERETRQAGQLTIVVTCMDERNTQIEEALGLIPGEAKVYASGGGKIDGATFGQVFGEAIAEAQAAGRGVRVLLTPHECNHNGQLGCAAFGNDVAAQTAFFGGLLEELVAAYPGLQVTAQSFDTASHQLRDLSQPAGATHAEQPILAKNVQHAGHGIYVGNAYRAWNDEVNRYFRLSPENPGLAGNLAIALKVMGHHSAVNLAVTPATLHVDYPVYAQDLAKTAAIRAKIDRDLAILRAPEADESPAQTAALQPAREHFAAGTIGLVVTATDVASWRTSDEHANVSPASMATAGVAEWQTQGT